ncbi:MAG: sulfotransferase domain-containing protein [Cyanobacteria bacterium P01_A01_bin.123]
MNQPNFLIVGAARSGTTALHYYLAQHPDIFMSARKEPNFFAYQDGTFDFPYPGDAEGKAKLLDYSVTNFESYLELFKGATDVAAVGEASPYYLLSEQAPDRIQNRLPNVKLIMILRDPVDRAYSHFLQAARSGNFNPDDFPNLLKAEEAENHWGWARHCVYISQYYTQISNYLESFDLDQIKIYLYDDLKTNPDELIESICNFLEVDTEFELDVSLQYNKSGVPKNKILDLLLSRKNILKPLLKNALPGSIVNILAKFQNRVQNYNLYKPPAISPEFRAFLVERYFREDILGLQTLIQRDLSAWLL